jgi:hypothetical protein
MPGRGPLTFKKRQREQQQKEKQAEKLARRLERKLKPADDAEDQVPDFSSGDTPDTRDPDEA